MTAAQSTEQQLAVRHASMQEPVRDPFGDQGVAAPRAYELPSNHRQIPRNQVPQSARPIGKQISILSGPDNDFPDPYEYLEEPEPISEFPADEVVVQEDEILDDGQFQQEFDRRLEQFESVDDSSDDRANSLRDSTDDLRQDDRGREPRSLLDIDESNEQRQVAKSGLLDISCEDFRNELLDNSIRDIALDISPPASELMKASDSVSRTWTDRSGNVIATGAMVDLRRGYVIVSGMGGTQRLAFARLSDADLAAVAEYWRFPEICGIGNRGTVERCWCPQTVTWTASSLCHKPLFFENIQLERYGHSHGPLAQPIRSVGHFFVSLFFVPYNSAIAPANECQYALGFYRPGDCAPWLKDPVPISLNGLARQAVVVTGLSFIP